MIKQPNKQCGVASPLQVLQASGGEDELKIEEEREGSQVSDTGAVHDLM